MQFVLKEEIEIDWPVDVPVPVDGGKFETQEFPARFRLLDQDKVDEILEGKSESPDLALMRAALVGWGKDFCDDKGKSVPYSDELRDRLLAKPYFRLAVARAYFDANTGGGGRRKN